MSTATFKNSDLAHAMEGMGFHLTKKSKQVGIEGTLGAVLKFTESLGSIPGAFEGRMREITKDRGSDGVGADWVGGTYDDLVNNLKGRLDMKPLHAKRDEFARTGIVDKLRVAMADINPRRKRRNSEYDGEWSYDRQWEIEPFQATTKTLMPGRTMDIICHFSVSSRAKADEINRYGAMAWAISDLIEAAGIGTRIELRYTARSVDENSRVDCQIRLEVKKPGQYLAPSLVAAAFQSVFFRRPVFSLFIAAANLHGEKSDSGLGLPVQESMRIKFENGRLELSPDVKFASSEEIEKEVMKSIRKEGAA